MKDNVDFSIHTAQCLHKVTTTEDAPIDTIIPTAQSANLARGGSLKTADVYFLFLFSLVPLSRPIILCLSSVAQDLPVIFCPSSSELTHRLHQQIRRGVFRSCIDPVR